MQIITGRLTDNAQIRTTKSNKQVVAFTLVENDHYKKKDGTKEQIKTFFNCTLWNGVAIAPHLKKGMLVSLYGRVGINSFQKRDGDFIANLTFNVSEVKFLAAAKESTAPQPAVSGTPAPEATAEIIEDLPF